MCKKITTKEEFENYITDIKAKKIFHEDIPDDYSNHPDIIRAELSVGIRYFTHRGYDVTRNTFFVSQTVKSKNFRGELEDVSIHDAIFDSFDEYYTYLDGDIYTSACYYQYVFSQEIIDNYNINLNKISTSAFTENTLSMCSKNFDKEDNIQNKNAKIRKTTLLKWHKKFCTCNSFAKLNRVAQDFEDSVNENWDYVLSSFVHDNPLQNIPLLVRLLLENKHIDNKELMTMLCIIYDDESIFDCFYSSYWKRKSEIKSLINRLTDKNIIHGRNKYYDADIDFYCIKKYIIDNNMRGYKCYKAYITHYYETFDEFAEACNYDLSDADLSQSNIKNIDISKFKMNSKTKLPLGCIENPVYCVHKYYDYKYDLFFVTEHYHEKTTDALLKYKKHEFKYFVDFVAFLEGDLSNADLLLCDGLRFLTDFSQLNLENAKLTSSIKEKAGIIKSEEYIKFHTPDIIKSTETAELSTLNDEILPHRELSYSERENCKKICYVSDLHLPQHIKSANVKTKDDIVAVIGKIANDLTLNIYSTDILLIVGDTSCDIECFKIFVKMLRAATPAKIVFVLGNHELWEFENTPFKDIVSTYKEILTKEKMYLLQNSILYLTDDSETFESIDENEITNMDISSLKKHLNRASTILFGGLAFSGLNNVFNANNSIYKNAITRNEEVKESSKIETLYTKVRNALPAREVVIATHMPLSDWSHDVEYHGGYAYISGHTHKNTFHDDGVIRIYADNQVGYYRQNICIKELYIDKKYDIFEDYIDGIYEITRTDYANFYRGKNIRMDFNRTFEHLYMLKRNNYYCFIIQTEKGKLSILNGGSTKIIKNKSIESCYDEMAEIIDVIKSPLDKFTTIQKSISNFVKSIGGDGRIHGAIIDIDYYNHIYVNPNDLKITGYYAQDMVNKQIYGSIEGLITAHCPKLLPSYKKYLSETSSTALILSKSEKNKFDSMPYYSTDIYSSSNILKKMQRLYSNILTIWPEKNQQKGLNNKNQNLLNN